MALIMFGPLVLLAASVSPAAAPPTPGAPNAASARPASIASAQATVSIRIISGVRFGADELYEAVGADRRSTSLSDASGAVRAAELLEFQ
jgi:hypothetical protein